MKGTEMRVEEMACLPEKVAFIPSSEDETSSEESGSIPIGRNSRYKDLKLKPCLT